LHARVFVGERGRLLIDVPERISEPGQDRTAVVRFQSVSSGFVELRSIELCATSNLRAGDPARLAEHQVLDPKR
jgi:hypothetical protein